MAEQKTKPTKQSVDKFIDQIEKEEVRDDCRTLIKLMSRITGHEPVLWGPSIVGFGKYHYKYASGHEGDSCLAAFSPRKPSITIYFYPDLEEREALLKNLGKHKASKGCLYVKRLSGIDMKVLEKIIKLGVEKIKKLYPE